MKKPLLIALTVCSLATGSLSCPSFAWTDLYAGDGTYLGNTNPNKFDPNSINNSFGQYGNEFSPTSIKNPYSQYGNPYTEVPVKSYDSNDFSIPSLEL